MKIAATSLLCVVSQHFTVVGPRLRTEHMVLGLEKDESSGLVPPNMIVSPNHPEHFWSLFQLHPRPSESEPSGYKKLYILVPYDNSS